MPAAMSLWVAATLFAASVQALRFLLQKRLAMGGLSPAAATFARFVWAPPVVFGGLALWSATAGAAVPRPPPSFWLPAVAGGLAQVAATVCVVALFAHRNFAVGIAFSKTTVLMTVVAGFLLLGEPVSAPALLAMVVGFGGVVLLSVPLGGTRWRPFNRASLLGLAAGAFFSVSAVGYRAATLTVEGPPVLRAAVTLGWVTLIQAGVLAAWLLWRDRAGLVAVVTRWRGTTPVAVTSIAGSLAWFTAYTLQTAAYVNAVGQVELILSVLISWLVLGERSTRRELLGIALLGGSVVALLALTG
jgi:drug/metabolite transporter (DMT)-like permease